MKRFFLIGMTISMMSALSAQEADVILPSEVAREQIIHEKAFSLSYSSAYVMPSWVSYKVTNSEVDKTNTKTGKYTENPKVTARSSSKKDYKDSGYTMAQLVNHWDVTHIEGAYEETWYMTNIVPMRQAFYRFIWAKAEDLIRYWAKDTEGLYVVCAPINKDAPFSTFGKNKVSTPKRYYKVVYDAKNQKALGFIFKNNVKSGSLKSYAVPVSKVEEETGINFFPSVDAELAKKLKGPIDFSLWNFEMKD